MTSLLTEIEEVAEKLKRSSNEDEALEYSRQLRELVEQLDVISETIGVEEELENDE